jgi:hypothetical protein
VRLGRLRSFASPETGSGSASSLVLRLAATGTCADLLEDARCQAPFVAVLTQLTPVRSHLGQLVLHVREQPAKAHCDSVERCSGPPTPPPPRPPLLIRQQTLGPPSPFVAILMQFVGFTLSSASISFIVRSSASAAARRVNREGCNLCSDFVEHRRRWPEVGEIAERIGPVGHQAATRFRPRSRSTTSAAKSSALRIAPLSAKPATNPFKETNAITGIGIPSSRARRRHGDAERLPDR